MCGPSGRAGSSGALHAAALHRLRDTRQPAGRRRRVEHRLGRPRQAGSATGQRQLACSPAGDGSEQGRVSVPAFARPAGACNAAPAAYSPSRRLSSPLAIRRPRSSHAADSEPLTKTIGKVGQPLHIFKRIAPAPLAEVAAVLEVVVRLAGGVELPACAPAQRIAATCRSTSTGCDRPWQPARCARCRRADWRRCRGSPGASGIRRGWCAA